MNFAPSRLAAWNVARQMIYLGNTEFDWMDDTDIATRSHEERQEAARRLVGEMYNEKLVIILILSLIVCNALYIEHLLGLSLENWLINLTIVITIAVFWIGTMTWCAMQGEKMSRKARMGLGGGHLTTSNESAPDSSSVHKS